MVDRIFWEEGKEIGNVLTREWKELEEVGWNQMVYSVQKKEQRVRTKLRTDYWGGLRKKSEQRV